MASGDMVLALDPGKSSGLAVFSKGVDGLWHLIEARQGPPAEVADRAVYFAWGPGKSTSLALVVERPQVYARGKGKGGDPSHMLDLYGQCRELFGRLLAVRGVCYPRAVPALVEYQPSEWKGQVPKSRTEADSIHQRRILEALESWELGLLPPAGKRYDCLDAVGLGLFFTGRTGRGGTAPYPL